MLKPLPGKLFIEPIEEKNVSTGGIILPDADKVYVKGLVAQLGAPLKYQDGQEEVLEFKEGDVVIYPKLNPVVLEYGGDKYHIASTRDIFAYDPDPLGDENKEEDQA